MQEPDIPPEGEESESTSPCSVINRWRNRDLVFEGLYRQGITPKKCLKKQTREPSFEREEEGGELKPRQNPFVVITPQILRKKPFYSHSPSSEDAQSPSNGTPKKASTPVEGKASHMLFEKTRENPTPRKRSAFFRSDRGKRFLQDYEEGNLIGRGNFGSVVKSTNRLDGLEYAVKISQKPNKKSTRLAPLIFKGSTILEEALHEVFALSALSVAGENPYIVRYYNGWIENDQLYIVVSLGLT